MRHALIGLMMAATAATASQAGVNVSIGINIPTYPRLVAVPGSAVYYSPTVDANYFFYDGLYWVFEGDQWLASSWYNGPWRPVGPEYIPVYLWQVPVRYYRRPPAYFHSWRRDSAPRWGDHWGADWRSRHEGRDHHGHHGHHARHAPLPNYQRQYTGNRYPQGDLQSQIQSQNYRYQPRDQSVREQYRQQAMAQQQLVQQQVQQQSVQQQQVQQQVQPPMGNPAQRGERSQPRGRGDGNQGHGDGNRGQNEGRGRDR